MSDFERDKARSVNRNLILENKLEKLIIVFLSISYQRRINQCCSKQCVGAGTLIAVSFKFIE